MKKAYLYAFTLFFLSLSLASGQSYIKMIYQPIPAIFNPDGIPFGFKYDTKKGVEITKGGFAKNNTYNFLTKIDFRINDNPYTADKNKLFLRNTMFLNEQIIFSYRHPNNNALLVRDTLVLPKIDYFTCATTSFGYNTAASPNFEVSFADGKLVSLGETQLSNFLSYYKMKIEMEYLVVNPENGQIIDSSNNNYLVFHSPFQTKSYTGILNEYLQFSLKSEDYFQQIAVPMNGDHSYFYDFSGADASYSAMGRDGSNVRVLIKEETPNLFSFHIERNGSMSQMGLINPNKAIIHIDVTGGNGGKGRSGENGQSASNHNFGSVYKAGQPGRNGDNGGNGGNGGTVTVVCPRSFQTYLSKIIVQYQGGSGGAGGDGGRGGRHQFASEQEYKRASYSDRFAADGYLGYSGQSGRNGRVDYVFVD